MAKAEFKCKLAEHYEIKEYITIKRPGSILITGWWVKVVSRAKDSEFPEHFKPSNQDVYKTEKQIKLKKGDEVIVLELGKKIIPSKRCDWCPAIIQNILKTGKQR